MKHRWQAHCVNVLQATKVALAIRWRVHPSDISDRRATREVVRDIVSRGEEVVAWQK